MQRFGAVSGNDPQYGNAEYERRRTNTEKKVDGSVQGIIKSALGNGLGDSKRIQIAGVFKMLVLI